MKLLVVLFILVGFTSAQAAPSCDTKVLSQMKRTVNKKYQGEVDYVEQIDRDQALHLIQESEEMSESASDKAYAKAEEHTGLFYDVAISARGGSGSVLALVNKNSCKVISNFIYWTE